MIGVDSSSTVPDLQEDLGSFSMDSVSNLFPSLDLSIAVDTSRSRERSTSGSDLRAFGKNKTSVSSKGVILDVSVGWDSISSVGSAPGEGGHDDSVL